MKDIDKLIDKAKLGNTKAFEKLYRLTSKETYWYCKRLCGNDLDSEDLLQEVYLTAWQKLGQFRGDNFKAWLRSIAHNTFLGGLKKRVPELLGEEALENLEEDELLGPEHIAHQKQIRIILLKAIESELTPVQRMTVMMFYYDEMSVGEIASAMDCSEGTVKSRLYLARKKLRDKFEKSGNTLLSGIPCIFPILRYEAQHSRKYPPLFRRTILPHIAKRALATGTKAIIAVGGTLTAVVSVLLITYPFPVSDNKEPEMISEPTSAVSASDDVQDSTESTAPLQASTQAETATASTHTSASTTIITTSAVSATVSTTSVSDSTAVATNTTTAALQETSGAAPTVTYVLSHTKSDTAAVTSTTIQTIIPTETTTTETVTEPVTSYIYESTEGSVHWYIDNNGIMVLEYKNAPTIGDIDDYYEQVENPDPLQRVTKPYLDDLILYAPWNAAVNGYDVNTVKVADSIYSIGGYAFYQLHAERFEMSDTVTHIKKMAFASSNIGTFIMSAQLKNYQSDIFTGANIGTMIYPEGTTDIVGQLLGKAGSVTEIELPLTLEALTSNEFTDCQGLERITILNPNISFPDDAALPENVVIYGFNGSTAQEYAESNGFAFVPI